MNQDEAIVAIATPPGNGAIGIIRLSGRGVIPILSTVWKGKTPPGRFEPRQVYLGQIWDPIKGESLDEALLFFMKAPHSYTGEDLIEIQAHGGAYLLERILELLLSVGARVAEPGEFTRRAFQNGRLDLVQAEAVADLINASSQEAARLASQQLSGALSQYVSKLRKNLLVLRAQMEAMIDFPEDEDVQGLHYNEVSERVESVSKLIVDLIATYQAGRAYREGVKIAIVGKPNVGKSSLLNALLGEERAIVHSLPGTTRDTVEETVLLNGLQVRFIDTAGLREGIESVEQEGIRRSWGKLQEADLVLVVFDSSRPWDSEDDLVFEAVSGRPHFALYNKIDLSPKFSSKELDQKIGSTPLLISTKTREGLDLLKERVRSHFLKKEFPSDMTITHLRHKLALEKGLVALARAGEAAKQKTSLEFLAADLLIAANHLAEITGEVTTDQLLDEIFSKFCIGK